MNNDEPELDSLNFIPKELLANQRARHAADRPAAPERDRWDEEAKRVIDEQCETVERDAGPLTIDTDGGYQTISASTIAAIAQTGLLCFRPTYAAGLRKAYSEGESTRDWEIVALKTAQAALNNLVASHHTREQQQAARIAKLKEFLSKALDWANHSAECAFRNSGVYECDCWIAAARADQAGGGTEGWQE